MRAIEETFAAIRESVDEAGSAFYKYSNAYGPRNDDFRAEQEQIVTFFVDCAFLQLRLFLEARGLAQFLSLLVQEHEEAKENFMKSVMRSWGEPESFWLERLYQYTRAIDSTYGTGSQGTVTKELEAILRATQYSIADIACFSAPPTNEHEVHVRVEAVLRCVFPNIRHKPAISKPIKNFIPDTGLPTVRTLIEYKFVATREDLPRIADELLADTRGYVSKEWDRFIYVIYETKRFQPEALWKELLRASDVGDNTRIIVISGEEPERSRTAETPNRKQAPAKINPSLKKESLLPSRRRGKLKERTKKRPR